MEEDQYRVVRQLDQVMPLAARAQKAGVSFDLRLYFREDDTGYQWAEIAFLDREHGHRILDDMPLVGEGVVGWFFDQISRRGLTACARAAHAGLSGTRVRSIWLGIDREQTLSRGLWSD